jgi:electron transfer flavoprotein beta subunit
MKILVCISNVPDTTTKVKFIDGKKFDAAGVQWIINPWDELALTRALELKEASNGAIKSVTVVNVGSVTNEPTIRKALAIGADDAIRINTEPIDGYSVAVQIAEVVKSENFDFIFTGIESSDFNGVTVGGIIAELLDISSVSAVSGVDFEGGIFKIKREIDGGTEKLIVKTPIAVTVQKGIAINPRIPAMRGIMQARTKPLKTIEPVSIEPFTEIVSYEMPQPKGKCKMVSAENVKELVNLLHNEAKAI